MVIPRRACGWLSVASWVVTFLLAWGRVSRAEGFRLESLGAWGGLSVHENGPAFNSAQGYANWTLPWGWELGKEWRLQSRLDVSAGWLGDSSDSAATGSVGPSLVLGRQRLPLSLEMGSSPTLLSDYEFGSKNLGSYGQFTSHIGLNWDIGRHWRLGYRLEHISNGGQAHHNPGLNMHVIGLSYRF